MKSIVFPELDSIDYQIEVSFWTFLDIMAIDCIEFFLPLYAARGRIESHTGFTVPFRAFPGGSPVRIHGKPCSVLWPFLPWFLVKMVAGK